MTELLPPDHVFASLQKNGYGTILADPPWRYRTWSETNQKKSAKNHYDLMTMEEIEALPIADLAAKDCTLFLWAVNPMLPHALDTMAKWGFIFKTVAFHWAKTTKHGKWHIGLGYWTRANSELCLLGTRGKPKRIAKDVRQLLISPVREHSRKPDETAQHIERLTNGPYLELFSRMERPGWAAWGKETDKFDPPMELQEAA